MEISTKFAPDYPEPKPEDCRLERKFFTPKEASVRLDVSDKTVIRLIEAGKIKAVNGSAGSKKARYYIPKLELERYLRALEPQPVYQMDW